MNKEEIEAKLHNYEERLKDIAKAIEELRDQVAKVEKPKLRHGDFGYSDEPVYPRIVLDDNKLATGIHVIDDNEADRPTVIFGNIFDLMEGWGEDFEDWESEIANLGDKRSITIGTLGKDIFMGTTGDSGSHSYKVAYEIWRKLGHALASLKRKQTK